MNNRRARACGTNPGFYGPGPNNEVTDMAGAAVWLYKVMEGKNGRTGATAVLPHGGESAAVGIGCHGNGLPGTDDLYSTS